jgi:adenine-specific DNA-methyltransferase
MNKMNINNRRYLGSKTKLLDLITSVVEKECESYDTFIDLFGGTGVVASVFNNESTSIIVNDILESNYVSYIAWFGNENYEKDKINNLINQYNNLDEVEDNYFSLNFANTYFSLENCRKIGFIRDDIEEKYQLQQINIRERAILITILLYSIDKIANTVGHYDAYRKNGDLQKKLELKMLELPHRNINSNNKIYKMDANKLVSQIKGDIVYIDPPYNSRQYSDAYHLLENIVSWEKKPVFGVAKKMKDRQHIKSKYCTIKASEQFSELINNINAKYILVSYNNMGAKGAGRSQAKISDSEIVSALEARGLVKTYEVDFNQFTTGKTNINNHKERLFLCKVGQFDGSNIKMSEELPELVKSPLNYTGGKYKLLKQILPKIPSNIDIFIDLFCGGANVGVNVKAKKIVCIDQQKEIIRIYNLFKKYDENYIINRIEKIINKYNLSNTKDYSYEYYGCNSSNGLGKYNKPYYIKLRSDYNNIKVDTEEKDFLFLTLIIYGFNNQIRFNSMKEFNMPVGKRDFNLITRRNLINFVKKINKLNIEFIDKDFRDFNMDFKNKNAFIYCDPPYSLGVASYNENGGWTEFDDKDLFVYLNEVSNRGIKFALSNVIEHKGFKNDNLINWALENKYNINYLNYNYNNCNYQTTGKENNTIEVLITNY